MLGAYSFTRRFFPSAAAVILRAAVGSSYRPLRAASKHRIASLARSARGIFSSMLFVGSSLVAVDSFIFVVGGGGAAGRAGRAGLLGRNVGELCRLLLYRPPTPGGGPGRHKKSAQRLGLWGL